MKINMHTTENWFSHLGSNESIYTFGNNVIIEKCVATLGSQLPKQKRSAVQIMCFVTKSSWKVWKWITARTKSSTMAKIPSKISLVLSWNIIPYKFHERTKIMNKIQTELQDF